MKSNLDQLTQRIKQISWKKNDLRRRSQARLVQEYLRRSAIWASVLKRANWPFYDVAEVVNPEVRVPGEMIDQILDWVPNGGTYYVSKTLNWSLQFANLQDVQGVDIDLPDPYDPLIRVYERGDSINYTPVGYIEVGGLSVPRGKAEKYARIKPLLDTSESVLQEIDDRS